MRERGWLILVLAPMPHGGWVLAGAVEALTLKWAIRRFRFAMHGRLV